MSRPSDRSSFCDERGFSLGNTYLLHLMPEKLIDYAYKTTKIRKLKTKHNGGILTRSALGSTDHTQDDQED